MEINGRNIQFNKVIVMVNISRQEVIKIAQASRIRFNENEINLLIPQLEAVLSYAECIQKIAVDAQGDVERNVNVFREDIAINSMPEPILSRAPQREGNYFVVPAILHNN